MKLIQVMDIDNKRRAWINPSAIQYARTTSGHAEGGALISAVWIQFTANLGVKVTEEEFMRLLAAGGIDAA